MLDSSQTALLHDLLLNEDWISAAHLLAAASSSPPDVAAEESMPTLSLVSRAIVEGMVTRTRTKAFLPSVFGDFGATLAKALTPGLLLDGNEGEISVVNREEFINPLDRPMRAGRFTKEKGQGDIVNPLRDPPLCWVARKNQPKLVDLLVEHNAGLECRHDGGATPLYLASQDGHAEVVRRLLKHGARVDAADRDGWLPIHAASQNGHVAVLDLLLEAHRMKKVSIDMASSNDGPEPRGVTSLHLACRENHVEVARRLLEAGAHPRARTCSNATPLHFAAGFGCVETVRLLVNKVGSLAGESAEAKEAAIISYIDSMDSSGSTALHYVARQRPRQAVAISEFLLSLGADAAIVNRLNRTPLRQAIASNLGDLVALLLDYDRVVPPSRWAGASVMGEREGVEALLQQAAKGNNRTATSTTLGSLQLDTIYALLVHSRNLEARCREAESRYQRLVSFHDEPIDNTEAAILPFNEHPSPLLDDPWRKESKDPTKPPIAATKADPKSPQISMDGLFETPPLSPLLGRGDSSNHLSTSKDENKPLFENPDFLAKWD